MVTEYHGRGNLSKTIDRLHVKFIAGSLCLDFVNTVGGRGVSGAAIRDKIASYDDLLAWSVLAGSVDHRHAGALARLTARGVENAANILARGIRLREALYRLFKSAMEGRRPGGTDFDVLRQELSIARAHQRLTAQSGRFIWMLPAYSAAPDRILWPIALAAAALLTSSDLARLGQCGGENCGWLFLDTSRNHRRQWCDMRDCGNRAKVQRFRQKQRG